MSDAPGRSNGKGSGVSRRDFLRGSGVTAATAALAGTAEAVVLQAAAEAQDKDKTEVASKGPGPVAVTLNVNGAEMKSNLEPRVTLLDALRNYLDVTGCKRVCDRGTCGACTVLVDGKPVYSCTMLAVEAQGRKIRTAESLIDGGKLDRVPAAFAKADAQQCGFCTPGFVVSMYAAFEANPAASPGEIEEALSGNICRCGTYEQMRDAIAALCKVKRKEA
jgi:xanthine dehydrogenase YagT iron-sulfur-binding subunit